MIQLFLHVRVDEVQVVDVVYLDLRRDSSTVAQDYGSSTDTCLAG